MIDTFLSFRTMFQSALRFAVVSDAFFGLEAYSAQEFQSALRFAVVSDGGLYGAASELSFQSALRFAVVSDRWPLRAWRDFKSRFNPL